MKSITKTLFKVDRGSMMPNNEKELNINLFDQLEIVERIRREAKRGGIEAVMEQLDIEQAAIERKLYQKPPLKSE